MSVCRCPRRFGAVALATLVLTPVALGDNPEPPRPTANTPDEPLAGSLSLARAGEFLDTAALAWTHDTKCGSCHTTYPYLLARPMLGDPKAPALLRMRAFFEGRVAEWDRGGKGAGLLKGDPGTKDTEGVTEVVAVAATLALHDAQSTGKLHPLTRQALDRMWEMQRPDGAWAWNKTRLTPLEHDDYYGAVYAALGVGHAPDGYARGDSAKDGVARLTQYLLKANQRESGRWFTRSLNRDRAHLIANAGTAYAVMALKACEPAEK